MYPVFRLRTSWRRKGDKTNFSRQDSIMRETDYLKENTKALDLLRRIDRFQTFSDEELGLFLALGKLKEYEAGETIIKKDDVDHWVYFLISGEVKIVKGEKTFAILKRHGDLFGEMGVIDGSPRSASVWALQKTMVLGLDCANLNDQRKEQATIFQYTIFRIFAESLAERLRITNDEVIRLLAELKQKNALIEQLSQQKDDKTMWL
jgi:CRP/FNR family cyclic AMP-dependent transcriptional regulator